MVGGHEPIFDCDFVRVHAAITDGVDRATFHFSAAVLVEHKTVRIAERLGHDEQTQTTVRFGAVRVGACQQHEHVGASTERAPSFDTIDDVAVDTVALRCDCRGF